MTVIVENCESKKGLKAAARALNLGANTKRDSTSWWWQPIFRDPSIFEPMNLGEPFKMEDFPAGFTLVCTNHPKRTWFATVSRDAAGKFKVE